MNKHDVLAIVVVVIGAVLAWLLGRQRGLENAREFEHIKRQALDISGNKD
jgi:hypothetical protein